MQRKRITKPCDGVYGSLCKYSLILCRQNVSPKGCMNLVSGARGVEMHKLGRLLKRNLLCREFFHNSGSKVLLSQTLVSQCERERHYAAIAIGGARNRCSRPFVHREPRSLPHQSARRLASAQRGRGDGEAAVQGRRHVT